MELIIAGMVHYLQSWDASPAQAGNEEIKKWMREMEDPHWPGNAGNEQESKREDRTE